MDPGKGGGAYAPPNKPIQNMNLIIITYVGASCTRWPAFCYIHCTESGLLNDCHLALAARLYAPSLTVRKRALVKCFSWAQLYLKCRNDNQH